MAENEDKKCIFCSIVSGERTADKVYEDENVIAFLDIRPVNPGHTLVIPKVHFESIYSTPDDVLSYLLPAAKKIALAIKKGLGADGVNIIMNNDPAAGQIIEHTHLHVIPRSNTDGLAHWPSRPYTEGESAKVADKIKSAL